MLQTIEWFDAEQLISVTPVSSCYGGERFEFVHHYSVAEAETTVQGGEHTEEFVLSGVIKKFNI